MLEYMRSLPGLNLTKDDLIIGHFDSRILDTLRASLDKSQELDNFAQLGARARSLTAQMRQNYMKDTQSAFSEKTLISKKSYFRWLPVILGVCLFTTSAPAEAAKYVLYLHGRSMDSFPGTAYIGSSAAWTHVGMSYNGSRRLNNPQVRNAIKEEIADRCTSTDCVIICYSAGCARMLLALEDLRAEGHYPSRFLWASAAGSAAGGTKLLLGNLWML